MVEVPIKRGTARRLGLNVPLPYLTVRIEPDLSALKALGSAAPTDSDWQRLCHQFQELVVDPDAAYPLVASKEGP